VRLVALVDSPDHVCCRYRLAAFRPFLERAGYTLQFRSWPRHSWSWLQLGELLRDAAVIVQRRLLSGWQLALLRRSAGTLVVDFDDAIFLRDSYAPKGPNSKRRLSRFIAMTRAADTLVAGNNFLRDQALRCNGAGRIHVVPTCVDPDQYPLAEHDRDKSEVQLVWVGSSSTLRGLEAIRPLLDNLGRECGPGLGLKIICDRFLKLRGLPVRACPWSAEHEALDIASADIGISWLPDDDWSRGKCGLKILQYMAAGLPVVANPVGVQVEMVRHGETGFLAATPAEWREAVTRLARDPGLRRWMGRVARLRVEREFSIAAGASRWLRLLAGVSQTRKAA